MPSYKGWLLIGIVVLLTAVGLPLIKRESVPAQAEPTEIIPIEIQVAELFVKSGLKYDCYAFVQVWQKLFPEANCYRKQIGKYGHWMCDLNEELLIDANYDWKQTIMIREK